MSHSRRWLRAPAFVAFAPENNRSVETFQDTGKQDGVSQGSKPREGKLVGDKGGVTGFVTELALVCVQADDV